MQHTVSHKDSILRLQTQGSFKRYIGGGGALYIPQKRPVNSAKHPCKLCISQKSPYILRKPFVCGLHTQGFFMGYIGLFCEIVGLFCGIYNLQGYFAELTGLFCGIYKASVQISFAHTRRALWKNTKALLRNTQYTGIFCLIQTSSPLLCKHLPHTHTGLFGEIYNIQGNFSEYTRLFCEICVFFEGINNTGLCRALLRNIRALLWNMQYAGLFFRINRALWRNTQALFRNIQYTGLCCEINRALWRNVRSFTALLCGRKKDNLHYAKTASSTHICAIHRPLLRNAQRSYGQQLIQ